MDSVVIGIDTAWTSRNPSGVALVKAAGYNLKLLKIGRCTREFITDRKMTFEDWLTGCPREDMINLKEILETGSNYTGRLPDAIALDIPLSPLPVRGRRKADNEISSRYGVRGAGTHTPSGERCGKVSACLFEKLTKMGYRWLSAAEKPQINEGNRYFIETYTHPVIIEMLGLEKRLQYKVAKRHRYWQDITPNERWEKIASELDRLRSALASRVDDLTVQVPEASTLLHASPRSKNAALKGIEDALDAVVCSLVAFEFLAGRARPFGDHLSAIWIPAFRPVGEGKV